MIVGRPNPRDQSPPDPPAIGEDGRVDQSRYGSKLSPTFRVRRGEAHNRP